MYFFRANYLTQARRAAYHCPAALGKDLSSS